MAKSDCGLPARSTATVQTSSSEEWSLRYDLAFGHITPTTYRKKIKELKGTGRIYRRR